MLPYSDSPLQFQLDVELERGIGVDCSVGFGVEVPIRVLISFSVGFGVISRGRVGVRVGIRVSIQVGPVVGFCWVWLGLLGFGVRVCRGVWIGHSVHFEVRVRVHIGVRAGIEV